MLHSCAPNANVVSNSLLQKRKYYNGWNNHFHLNSNASKKNTENLAFNLPSKIKEEHLPKIQSEVDSVEYKTTPNLSNESETNSDSLEQTTDIPAKKQTLWNTTRKAILTQVNSTSRLQQFPLNRFKTAFNLEKKTTQIASEGKNSKSIVYSVLFWISLALLFLFLLLIFTALLGAETTAFASIFMIYCLLFILEVTKKIIAKGIPEESVDDELKTKKRISSIVFIFLVVLPLISVVVLICALFYLLTHH